MGWRDRRMIRRELDVLRDTLEARVLELAGPPAGYPYTVTRLPIVIAARALIADDAAMLPITGVRDGEALDPTPTILLRPDPSMSRRRFVHRSAMSLSGWGNLYLYLTRVGFDGWPLAATLLHPSMVWPNLETDGVTIGSWQYNGSTYPLESIVHVPLWELDLRAVSSSPLGECQQALDDLAVLWGFAAGYWRDGGLPPYVLRHPSRLSADQATEALDQWLTARAASRPGMLTGQWEINALPTPSAADALLLDGLAYIDQTVARVFGVTPTLLNVRAEQGSLTYSNAQDETTRWLNLSFYPTWLARLEDALSAMLPRGQEAMFDTSAFGNLGLTRPGTDEARAGGAPGTPAPAPNPTVAAAGTSSSSANGG